MNHDLPQLIAAASFLCALLNFSYGQLNPLREEWSSIDEVTRVVEPFYQALKKEDWAAVSVYCALTADSKPHRFYLETNRRIDKESKWQFLRSYPANYTDPTTGLAPDECRLVMSIYQVPENSAKASQARLDLWLRTKDKWLVLPEQEISHKTAIHINNVPLDGRSIGDQFESLTAIEEKVRSVRTREERDDAILSQSHTMLMGLESKLLEVSQNKDLTPDQKQSAIKKIVEAVREATVEAQIES